MKLQILSIGRDRSGLFEPAVQEYVLRIRKHTPVELIELKESENKEKEAQALLARTTPRAVLICLDERGKMPNSLQWASKFQEWMSASKDVSFVIGGDEGHSQTMRDAATEVWSLGTIVMPHRLVRVILAEQIYRAFTILRREPYHK